MSVESLLTKILSRLDNIESQIVGGGGSGDAKDLPRSVAKFDDYMEATLDPFVDACNKLGGDLTGVAAIIKEAWTEQRKFLVMASECKAPEGSELMGLLGPIATGMKAVSGSIKRNEWETHIKALTEGVSSLNWLCVKPGPVDVVETGLDGFTFNANKIRKEHKTTNPDQIAFCDAGKAFFDGLVTYVKENHKAGLMWKAGGADVKSWIPGASAAAPAPAATAAAPAAAPAAAVPAAKAGDSKGLFSALNAGMGITGGLKKVTKDMKSSNINAPPAPVAAPKAVPRTNANVPKGPAVCSLAPNGRWAVENQTGACTVDITDNLKESVYIYGCIGATITINGKCKSVTVDKCQKTNVYCDETFASFEVVNCKRQHIGIKKTCKAFSIDKTDGITVFVSDEAKNSIEISASKSSEMNLQWNDADGELVERPIPEQYVHRIKDNKVTFDVSDLYSS